MTVQVTYEMRRAALIERGYFSPEVFRKMWGEFDCRTLTSVN